MLETATVSHIKVLSVSLLKLSCEHNPSTDENHALLNGPYREIVLSNFFSNQVQTSRLGTTGVNVD